MLRRLAVALTALVLVALLVVAIWPIALGLQRANGIAQFVSLRGAATLGILVAGLFVLLLALAVRSFRRLGSMLAVLLLIGAVIDGGIVLTRGIGVGAAATGRADAAITVLAWNTLGDAPGPQTIAELSLETGADVVSLPETTEDTAIEVAVLMREAGRPMWVNTLSFGDAVAARSTSLLTSADLGQYVRDDSRGTTGAVPTVIAVPADGSGPTIIAAHPVAPIPGYFDTWRSDLEWLAGVCVGDDVIMAGDLNSTLDHYAGLGDSGVLGDCVDAAKSTGDAGVGTWPASVPPLLGAPIDHVMSTPDWTAIDTQVIEERDDAGSDHRPIVATLVPAG